MKTRERFEPKQDKDPIWADWEYEIYQRFARTRTRFKWNNNTGQNWVKLDIDPFRRNEFADVCKQNQDVFPVWNKWDLEQSENKAPI